MKIIPFRDYYIWQLSSIRKKRISLWHIRQYVLKHLTKSLHIFFLFEKDKFFLKTIIFDLHSSSPPPSPSFFIEHLFSSLVAKNIYSISVIHQIFHYFMMPIHNISQDVLHSVFFVLFFFSFLRNGDRKNEERTEQIKKEL